MINGSYSAREISTPSFISKVPDSIGISLRIVIKKDVLPAPTVPITATFSPLESLSVMLFRMHAS